MEVLWIYTLKVPKSVNFLFFEKTNLNLDHTFFWAKKLIPSQIWAHLKFGRRKSPNLAIWYLSFLECLMLEFKSEAEKSTKLSNQNSKTKRSFHCAQWRRRWLYRASLCNPEIPLGFSDGVFSLKSAHFCSIWEEFAHFWGKLFFKSALRKK